MKGLHIVIIISTVSTFPKKIREYKDDKNRINLAEIIASALLTTRGVILIVAEIIG